LDERPFSYPVQIRIAERLKSGDLALSALAFTLAPHLQIINYHGRFSRFHGI